MPAGVSSAERSATTVALLRARGVVDGLMRFALVCAVAALIGLGLLPRTGWYRTVTVLSGSMKPAFGPGDMVVVTPERARDVRVGQAISYRIPVGDHHVQTHRVVAVLHPGAHPVVRTKGDANAAADPWTAKLEGDTVWRVRAVLPKLGWPLFWLRRPLVHELTLFLAPLLLALLGVLRIWRTPNDELDPDDALPTHPA